MRTKRSTTAALLAATLTPLLGVVPSVSAAVADPQPVTPFVPASTGPRAGRRLAEVAGQGDRRLRPHRPAQLLLRPGRSCPHRGPQRPHPSRHPGRQAAPAGPRSLHGRALHDDPRGPCRGRPRRGRRTPAAAYPRRSRSTPTRWSPTRRPTTRSPSPASAEAPASRSSYVDHGGVAARVDQHLGDCAVAEQRPRCRLPRPAAGRSSRCRTGSASRGRCTRGRARRRDARATSRWRPRRLPAGPG